MKIISNLQKSTAPVAVKKFVKENDLRMLSCGRYELSHGIYVNIEKYITFSFAEKLYEEHKRYADIQYLVDGQETIFSCCDRTAVATKLYDENDDISFFYSMEIANKYEMNAGEALLVLPQEKHKPCINFCENMPIEVKKAVFKVPLSYYKTIKYLVIDVDGTLTDGRVFYNQMGESFKSFNIKDGLGIKEILSKYGIEPVIITGRKSAVVDLRAKELGITKVNQGVSDKLKCLRENFNSDDMPKVAYIGDDINDLECMFEVRNYGGLVGCPNDATSMVKNMSDYIARSKGGEGAVREFIDWIVLPIEEKSRI